MAFVQMMEMTTSKLAEFKAIDREWRDATEGKRTLRRATLLQDRNDRHHIVVLAFFDSFESAMENSNLPETTAFAERLATLAEGSLVFSDFEVLEEIS